MEKIELQAGMLVKSLKGHDSGGLYAAIKIVSPEFALIADGKKRKLDNPKLKRVKHLKILFDGTNPVRTDTEKITDVKIAKFIKDYVGRE